MKGKCLQTWKFANLKGSRMNGEAELIAGLIVLIVTSVAYFWGE